MQIYIVIRKKPTKNPNFFAFQKIQKVFTKEEDAQKYVDMVSKVVPKAKFVYVCKDLTESEI